MLFRSSLDRSEPTRYRPDWGGVAHAAATLGVTFVSGTAASGTAAGKALRIWVPGCATGEEAYSIAMLVQDLVTARGEKWDVRIFATDLDKFSIEYAGRGLYPKSIAADVAPELLAPFPPVTLLPEKLQRLKVITPFKRL